jgi:hypothetical protein
VLTSKKACYHTNSICKAFILLCFKSKTWSLLLEPCFEPCRGSPVTNFTAKAGNIDIQKKFDGALPTTIYQAGFSEVYGQNPDIDSTALIISTTSWILDRSLKNEENEQKQQRRGSLSGGSSASLSSSVMAPEQSSDYVSALLSKDAITDQVRVAEFAVPRMLKAIEYLNSRDLDNDGILEQNYNEDWMDTALRASKIVYSQAWKG